MTGRQRGRMNSPIGTIEVETCVRGAVTSISFVEQAEANVGPGGDACQRACEVSAIRPAAGDRVDVLLLDKTGTVTIGKPSVVDLLPVDGISSVELLQKAASLESGSEHPVALAIMSAAAEKDIKPVSHEQFKAIAGMGVQGRVEGKSLMLGNSRLLRENGIDLSGIEQRASELADQGKTVIYVAEEYALLGALTISDPVRDDSTEAVKKLHELGLRLVMLSGDSHKSAQRVALEVGIENVIAEVLPEQAGTWIVVSTYRARAGRRRSLGE